MSKYIGYLLHARIAHYVYERDMNNRLKFCNKGQSEFYSAVRKEVDEYFKESKLSIHANSAMWLKVAFFLTGYFGLYFAILFSGLNWPILLIFGILLGMFGAFVGFNICHDAIHKSLSANKTVNKIFSYVFNLLGASPYVWNICHNIVHHTYTNIAGHDEDIDVAPGLIRFSETETVNKLQRYQHFYAFGLYSFAMLSWVFRKDYKKFYQKKIGEHYNKHEKMEHFNLFFNKAIYYFFFLVLPMLVIDLPWWQLLIGFLAMQLSQGLILGLVFQLAHVVEGTTFPNPNAEGSIEEAWAVHQLRTTANFACDSKVAAFFCGGLNQQIEHHLFPKICHIHYPVVGKIVKENALKFSLPYIENKTFSCALSSHYKMLKKLGRETYDLNPMINR